MSSAALAKSVALLAANCTISGRSPAKVAKLEGFSLVIESRLASSPRFLYISLTQRIRLTSLLLHLQEVISATQ